MLVAAMAPPPPRCFCLSLCYKHAYMHTCVRTYTLMARKHETRQILNAFYLIFILIFI